MAGAAPRSGSSGKLGIGSLGTRRQRYWFGLIGVLALAVPYAVVLAAAIRAQFEIPTSVASIPAVQLPAVQFPEIAVPRLGRVAAAPALRAAHPAASASSVPTRTSRRVVTRRVVSRRAPGAPAVTRVPVVSSHFSFPVSHQKPRKLTPSVGSASVTGLAGALNNAPVVTSGQTTQLPAGSPTVPTPSSTAATSSPAALPASPPAQPAAPAANPTQPTPPASGYGSAARHGEHLALGKTAGGGLRRAHDDLATASAATAASAAPASDSVAATDAAPATASTGSATAAASTSSATAAAATNSATAAASTDSAAATTAATSAATAVAPATTAAPATATTNSAPAPTTNSTTAVTDSTTTAPAPSTTGTAGSTSGSAPATGDPSDVAPTPAAGSSNQGSTSDVNQTASTPSLPTGTSSATSISSEPSTAQITSPQEQTDTVTSTTTVVTQAAPVTSVSTTVTAPTTANLTALTVETNAPAVSQAGAGSLSVSGLSAAAPTVTAAGPGSTSGASATAASDTPSPASATVTSTSTGGPASGADSAAAGTSDLAAPPPTTSSSSPTSATLAPSDPAAVPGSGRGPPGSVLINAATGGSVTSGAATLTFAPGSLPADAYVSITPETVSVPGVGTTLAYDLQAINVATGAKIELFNSPPVLTISGSAAGSQIYYLSPTSGPQAISSSFDSSTGAVSAGLPHFSTYAVLSTGYWDISLTEATENITLRVDNSSLDLIENTTTIESAPLSQIQSGVLITSVGNVNLTIDLTGGDLTVPIYLTGGSGTNTVSIPNLITDSTWTWNGTTLYGTSPGGDFAPITLTNVQQLTVDSTVDNTLTGPATASTWKVTGTETGVIDGLAFSGFDNIKSGSGASTDTLDAPTATAPATGSGAVLGINYTGIASTNSVAVANLSYQAPSEQNAITLSAGPTAGELTITDINSTVGSSGGDYVASPATTLTILVPTASLQISGDPNDTTTVTIDPSALGTGYFTSGSLLIDADAEQVTYAIPSLTLTLSQPSDMQNTTDSRSVDVSMSGTNYSIAVDDNTVLVPDAGITSMSIASVDGQDNDITLDLTGGALTVPISVDGGSGNTSLSLTGLTADSSWSWNGTSGTATSSGSDFQPISYTNIDSISADGPGNSLTGPATPTQSTWTITGNNSGTVDGLDFSGFDSITGNGTDTLSSPTPVGSSSVLGISFSGMQTTQYGAVDTFTYSVPTTNSTATTTITIEDDPGGPDNANMEITWTSSVPNGSNPPIVTSATIPLIAPQTELVVEAGTSATNTVVIGTLTAFSGQLTLVGGSGTNILDGPKNPTSWTLAGTGTGSGGPSSSSPVNWGTASSIDPGNSLTAISCNSDGVCVAGDEHGDLVSAASPGGPWTVYHADGTNKIDAISCTGTTCVAVDSVGNVLTASTSSLTSWTATSIDAGKALTGVSCTSDDALCVAVDGAGNVLTSPGETGPWTLANVDSTNALTGVSCASATLCVATDNLGDVVSSVNPTGGSSAWTVTDVDAHAPLMAVSCTSESLCVASDAAGGVVTSQDPDAGASAWNYADVGDGFPVDSVSCSGAICVAVDTLGEAITSNAPPDAPWTATEVALLLGPELTGVSCASQSECVAVDSYGEVYIASAPATQGFTGSTAFTDFQTLNGSGQDSLTGSFSDSTTWTITNPTTGSGSVTGEGESNGGPETPFDEITFSGMSSLIGGQGSPGDNYLADTSPAAYTITGTGTGTIAALSSSTSMSFGGFDYIQASDTGLDTISGPSTGTTWTVQSGGFTVDGLTVTGVTDLIGNGNLGKTGDTFIGPSGTSTWTVGAAEAVTVGTYSLSAFSTLQSGSVSDTLQGPAGGSAWMIDGNGSGTLTPTGDNPIAFIGFAHLVGAGSDALAAPGWVASSASSGTVAGASYSGMATPTSTSAATFTYYGNPAGGDTITIHSTTGPNEIAMEVDGAFGDVQFADPSTQLIVDTFGNGNTVTYESLDGGIQSLAINGGTGTGNTLADSTTATTFSSDGAGNGTIGGSGNTYTGFQTLVGNSGADILQGTTDPANANSWTVTGPGTFAGTVDGTLGTVTFDNFATIAGENGTDTLTGPSSATTWTVTGTNAGSILGATFTGIYTITGAGGADALDGPSVGATFTITGNDTGNVDGITFQGFHTLNGNTAGPNTLDIPCITTPTAPSGSCDGITYSGMQTVSNQPLSTYTFDGTPGDTITLTSIPGGLQIVDSSGTTQFKAPTGTLIIQGKQGSSSKAASITVDALSDSMSLEIFGDKQVDLTEKDLSATNLNSSAAQAAQGALLGSDYTSVTIAGNLDLGSGDLVSLSNTFTLNPNVSITTTGDVIVFTDNLSLSVLNLLPVYVTNIDSSISIGNGASVTAGNIQLVSYSSDQGSLTTAIDMGTGGQVKNAVGTALQLILSHLGQLPISILIKSASTSVTVGQNAALDATTGSIEILSEAEVASAGSPDSEFFTFGYGQAEATATVDVESGATLTAYDTVDVFADGDAVANISAKTPRYVGQNPPDPTQTVLAVAASNAEVTATATLAAGASITADNGPANFRADGAIQSEAEGSAGNYNNGTVGIALGLEFSSSNINTDVEGDITSGEGTVRLLINPTVSCTPATEADDASCPQGYVDLTNWIINVGPNALQTGDAVQYSNSQATSIGGPLEGLVSGTTYYVIKVTDQPDLIQLAISLPNAFVGAAFEFGDNYITLPNTEDTSVVTKTFDGSAISGNDITVSLDQASGSGLTFSLFGAALGEGQPVQYIQDPGGTGIPGLISGQIYYVIAGESVFNLTGNSRLIPGGMETIELASTYGAAEADVPINLDCPANPTSGQSCGGSGYELLALHVLDPEMSSGIGVTANLESDDTAEATASLSDPSTGKLATLKNIKNQITQPLANRLFDALSWKLATYLGQNKTQTPQKQSVAVAGGFGFEYVDHNVSTTIGSKAVLTTTGSMYAIAEIEESMQLEGEASISGTEADPKKNKAASQHNTSISVGLAIADQSNNATVTVDSGAQTNSPSDTFIYSEVTYPILSNLSNLPGSVGELTGLMQSEGPSTIVSNLTDGSLGLISSFANGYTDSTAEAEKLAIAGSATFFFLTNTVKSYIDSGALINQNEANTKPDEIVLVAAYNEQQLISVAGNLNTVKSFDINPVGSSSKSGGFGGAIDGLVLNNTTQAVIEPGAKISSGLNDGTQLQALELVMDMEFSEAGASADSTAIGGSLTLLDQTSNTLAQLSSGTTVTGGPVGVSSESDETAINGAGSIVTGHGTGIGVGIVVSLVNRTTQAIVGNQDLSAPGNGGGVTGSTGVDVDVAGGVDVAATNSGDIWSIAVAGSIATKQKQQAQSSDQPSSPQTADGADQSDPSDDPLDSVSEPMVLGDQGTSGQQEGKGAETGVSIAGAVTVTIVTDTTQAYINDLGSITPGGDVDVTANQSTFVAGGTGALAIDTGTGSKTNVAFAGAVSYNGINDTTQAFVIGITIPTSSGGLDVEATRTGQLYMASIGAAGSTASGRSIGVAGSVSWNVISSDTDAALIGVSATLAGSATLNASDSTNEISIAGAGAYGGEVGVGAALALNEINQCTRTFVEPLGTAIPSCSTTAKVSPATSGTPVSLTLGGSYTQTATDAINVISVGLSIGIGQSAVAFTIAINLGNTVAQADLNNATIDSTAGGATITASDTSRIQAGIGALALGVIQPSPDPESSGNSGNTHVAIGISIAVNSVDQAVPVGLDNTTVDVTGPIDISSSATGYIYTVGVAGGLTFSSSSSSGSSGFQFAGAGVVMVNLMSGDITADVTNGSLTTTGSTSDIDISASDGTQINADAGAASLLINLNAQPSSGIAVGAAVAYNQDDRTIQAQTSGTGLNSGEAINVNASSTASVTTWALGIAAAISSGSGGSGVSIAGAGSAGVANISQTVNAIISGGSVVADTGVVVKATDSATINTQAGGVAFVLARGPPNAVAIGLSIAVNNITENVTGQITGASKVSAATLSITAKSDSTINAWTIAGGGSVSTGQSGGGFDFNGAGAGSGNTIDNTVLADLSDVPNVTLTGTSQTQISATDSSVVFTVAGAAAFGLRISSSGGANISIGAAIAINNIDNSVHATVSDVPVFTTPGGLSLMATENAVIEAITIGVAGTVSGGSGGGASISGAGSGSGNTITTSTEATITSSTVTAKPTTGTANIVVSATDSSSIETIAGALALAVKAGGSASGSVAVGLSVAASTITPTVLAEVSGSSLTANGNIGVSAISQNAGQDPTFTYPSGNTFVSVDNASPGINAYALGGGVAVSAGSGVQAGVAVGGAVAVNTIGGSTQAMIDNAKTPIGSTISAGGTLTVSGQESRTISALTVAGTVSVAAGDTSVAVSIGLSIAENTISTSMAAAIISSSVTKASSVSVTTADSASISSSSASAAVSVAVGDNGVAIGGGGAVSLNVINTTANAYVESSTLGTRTAEIGAVSINSTSTGAITAIVVAFSASVSVGGEAGVSVAIGISVARNLIGWQPTGLASTTYQSACPASATDLSDCLPSTLNTGETVAVTAGPLAGETFKYIGPDVSGSVIYLGRQNFGDTSNWSLDPGVTSPTYTTDDTPASIADGDTVEVTSGPDAGNVYEYIGSGIPDEIDLSVQSYDDVTAWTQVGETNTDGQVQAYSSGSSIESSGALTIKASETSTINATVIAAAVSVGGGGSVGVGVSAAGTFAQNQIANDVRAYVDGDGAGISVASVAITATDAAGIHVLAGAASVGVGVGAAAGVAVSIGLSIALNSVSGAVNAYIAGVSNSLATTSGGIAINANESGIPVNDKTTGTQLDLSTYGITGSQLDELANEQNSDQQTDPNLSSLDPALTTAGVPIPSSTTTWNISVAPLDGSAPGISPAVPGTSWEIATNGGPTYVVTDVGGHLLVSQSTIDATAFAASLAFSFSSGGGVSVSGAGAVAINTITTQANAHIDSSNNVSSHTTVSLQATSTAAITATIVAASVAVGASASAGIGVSIGVSIAQNTIGTSSTPAQVQAYIYQSSVSANGALSLTATSSESIGALVLAASAAVGGGADVGVGASGAGVSATNSIAVDTEAYIDGSGANGISASAITLNAHDTSTIQGYAGAASLAVAIGTFAGVAVSIGVSLAENDIANVVQASISNANSLSAGTGALSLTAQEGASINAVTWAASVAVGGSVFAGIAVSGAGASALNDITSQTNAFIASSNVTEAGSVPMMATDTSTISAVVAAASAALGAGAAGVGVSIGVALARNIIGWEPNPNETSDKTSNQTPSALNDGDVVQVVSGPRAGDFYSYTGTAQSPTTVDLGDVDYSNTSLWKQVQNVSSPTYQLSDTPTAVDNGDTVEVHGGAVYRYVGSSPLGPFVDLSTQDYGNPQDWTQVGQANSPLQVQAFILDSSISTGGALNQTATSNQTINATVVAASAAIAAGLGGVAGAGAGASTQNQIDDQVRAYIDGSGATGISAASVTQSAMDTSSISVVTGAAALSFAVGVVAVSISIGVALAENYISNDVEAYIANATVTTTGGAVGLTAQESATISSTTEAAGLAVAIGGLAAGLAGAGADAVNAIDTTTLAHIDSSTVDADGGGVSLSASTPASLDITATVKAGAVGAAGGAVGIGAAIGVALAQNLIGYNADGSAGNAAVEAYVDNSSVDAEGALQIDATTAAVINAEVDSGAVAVAGGIVGIGLAGAGDDVVNKSALDVEAFIEGDGSTGISAYAIEIAARDNSQITATADGVAVAAAIGVVAGAVSVGVSIADNEIANRVLACIEGVDQTTTSPDSACVNDTTAASTTDPGITTTAPTGVTVASLGLAAYSSGDGSTPLVPGDLVSAASGTYRYIGTAQTVDLSTANYSDTTQWVPVAVGDISVTAGESASIDAEAQGTAVSASLGLGALSLAGAGASAKNVITTDTGAHVVSADVTSAGSVDVLSSDAGGITAHVSTAAGSGSIGGVGVSASIGSSLARNYIGYNPQGGTQARRRSPPTRRRRSATATSS